MSVKTPISIVRSLEKIRRTNLFIPGYGAFNGQAVAESLEDVLGTSQILGRNLGSSIDGSTNVPKTPSAIQAKHIGGGLVDVAINDQPLHPATTYFVELANNPGFSGARVVHASPSRNASLVLPNGKWYLRAYSQYQYSGSSSNAGDPPPATSVVVTGSIASGTLLGSHGSGTGSGQTPGAGFGSFEPAQQATGQPPVQPIGGSASASNIVPGGSGVVFASAVLSADVDVAASTPVALSSAAITLAMPPGGPFRILTFGAVTYSANSQSLWKAWINDGANSWNGKSAGINAANLLYQSIDLANISPTQYGAGTSVTLTPYAESSGSYSPGVKALDNFGGIGTWIAAVAIPAIN